MRLTIKHHTRYRYEEAAAAAIQVLRLTPRNHDGQAIRHWRVEIDADCKLDRDEDAFGNVTHTFSIDGPVSEVNVRVEGMVETSDTDGKVEGTRERFPPGFWLRRSALTMPSREIEVLAENINAGEGGDHLASLHTLMSTIHRDIRFVIGDTTSATTAAESFERGSGVCQDLAQIFVAAARSLAIPARYVGGYFLRTDTNEQVAGHAWAEAWLPRIGWIGFDPANCVCVDERYVRIALGVDSMDAAPIRGVRSGGGGETMVVAVQVAQVQVQVMGHQ